VRLRRLFPASLSVPADSSDYSSDGKKMTQQTRTLVFPKNDSAATDRLKAALLSNGFTLREIQYAALAGIRDKDVVTLYGTGRLVVQGQNLETLISDLGLADNSVRQATDQHAPSHLSITPAGSWIGTDESGKGDYFGPLVVAGVRLESTIAPAIKALGAQDSKLLTESAIRRIGAELLHIVTNSIVVIGPERYNQLYSEMRNVNTLLAWGHARCIENILEKADASLAIADQFGDERFILSALMKRGKTIRLDQHPHAEDDVAVASASILARLEFLNRMERLSLEAGFQLPKGAGAEVETAARRLVASKGREALSHFGKVHFRTTAKVLGQITE
jgi:ribonuclease HIII